MKKIFNLLLYSSFVFLAYYLYKNDFLVIPNNVRWQYVAFALISLVLGNVMQSLCWKNTLEDQTIKVSPRQAIVSQGLSVFMKYMPGKIMTIVGRSAYVSKVTDSDTMECSISSFRAQVIELIFGVGIGVMVFFFIEVDQMLLILSGVMLVGFVALLVFLKQFLKLFIFLAKKFGKTLNFQPFSVKFSLKKVFLFCLHWVFWGGGFFLLAKSLVPTAPFYLIFAFPLATVLGVAAIFAPGGVGIRESTLVLLLSLAGIEVGIATTLAVFSRLWFLAGDFAIFSVATFLKR